MVVPVGRVGAAGAGDLAGVRAAVAADRSVDDADDGSPLALLRQLLARIEVEAAPRADGADEVVLRALIGGRRYTLVRADEPAAGPRPTISPREREIVRLVARGLPNKVI